MKTVGIIAEYNPFHLGHLRQIQYCRKQLQADFLVIAMSGDYVQRGTPALLSKQIRTEMALKCGADLVLEIPVPFSCASAEFFALGGTALLHGIGITDQLCFGSEAGKIQPFFKIASILTKEPDSYQNLLRQNLKQGKSFPAARSEALLHYLTEQTPSINVDFYRDFLLSPNNILGIEYCKALYVLKSSVQPVTLYREGAGYHDLTISHHALPSASGIRSQIRKHGRQKSALIQEDDLFLSIQNTLPKECHALFRESLCKNRFVMEEDLDLLLHYTLLSASEDSLCQAPDLSPELARRILSHLNSYTGFLPFCQLLKTKEVTQTRIQRALLQHLLHIQQVPKSLPYARVLGFRKHASVLLKESKKKGHLPLLTKLADAHKYLDAEGLAVLEKNTFASNLYESILCAKEHRNFIHEYQKSVIIVD